MPRQGLHSAQDVAVVKEPPNWFKKKCGNGYFLHAQVIARQTGTSRFVGNGMEEERAHAAWSRTCEPLILS